MRKNELKFIDNNLRNAMAANFVPFQEHFFSVKTNI